MPLDPAKADAKNAAITEAFELIGQSKPTHQPTSRRNGEPMAWEYLVASHLAKLAEARKRAAMSAAVAAGVMIDPKKEPWPEGTERTVYAGDVVCIALSVGKAAKKIDLPAFLNALEKNGVNRALMTRLLEAHTGEQASPHKFTATLITH